MTLTRKIRLIAITIVPAIAFALFALAGPGSALASQAARPDGSCDCTYLGFCFSQGSCFMGKTCKCGLFGFGCGWKPGCTP